MRDSDQQKCYDAEGFAFTATIYEAPQGLWTIEECARKMTRTNAWSDARGGMVTVRAARVDATRSSARRIDRTIRIAHGQDTVATLWHELAHLVSNDGHGPDFRGREIECARLGGGDSAATRLAGAFERAGLSFTQFPHWESGAAGGVCGELLVHADHSRHARRVAALLQKASSTTKEESEALMTKALELSNTYGVNAAALAALQQHEEGLCEKIVRVGSGPYVGVRTTLLDAVAKGNWCRVSWNNDREGRVISVVGHEGDVTRTLMIFGGLDFEAQRIVLGLTPKGNTVKFRRSWLSGFAQGVSTTLARSTKEQVKVVDGEAGSTSTALVLAAREKKVEDFQRQLVGPVQKVYSHAQDSIGAYWAGQKEGATRAQGKEALVSGRRALTR